MTRDPVGGGLMKSRPFVPAGGADGQQRLRLRPPWRPRGDGGAARHEAAPGPRPVPVPGERQRGRGLLRLLLLALGDAGAR